MIKMKKIIIKLMTFWMPKKLKKKLKNFINTTTFMKLQQKTFMKLQQRIKNRIKKQQKLRVAFLCMYDSAFQYSSIFEKMLEDDFFEPFIVVIPDVLRGGIIWLQR